MASSDQKSLKRKEIEPLDPQEKKAKLDEPTSPYVGLKEISISEQQENDDGVFPLVISPVESLKIESLEDVLNSNKKVLDDKLATHGAILYRGFPLESAKDFLAFLTPFDFKYGDYIGGGGPRSVVLGPIHNSTETPPEFKIPFHHELAYLTRNPGKLLFFCETVPKEDGETPILLSHRLYKKIYKANKEFVENVEKKRVVYTRVLADKSKCDRRFQRAWQDVFSTEDRKEAETRALETGTEKIEWLEDDAMKVTSKPLDGVVIDPRTKKPTWFNSVVLLHPATQEKDKKSLWQVTYGDGSPIPDEHVLAAQKAMEENGVAFKWQKGDVMIVDNKLALHARNHFTPPRLILAAIAD